VHGFTGHPERTWSQKVARGPDDESDRPSKFRRLATGNHPRQEDTRTSVYWPRHLLPSIVPEARVLTYGYDTRLRHKFGSPGIKDNNVYDIAGDFLVALESERREDPKRPTLFIVHSLGGIVVKEMLRRSKGYSDHQTHLRTIYESTTAVMFFGTPHGGADPRRLLQHVFQAIIEMFGFSADKQIADALLPSSERLRELRDEFGPMARRQEWIIHSFQEQAGVGALEGRKVGLRMDTLAISLPYKGRGRYFILPE
jgi:hypothetical protein